MKRFISITILLLLLISIIGITTSAYALSDVSVFYNCKHYTYQERAELYEEINRIRDLKNSAYTMAQAARELGYKEDHDVIILAKKEWQTANEKYQICVNKYNELIIKYNKAFEAKEKEYPTATYIWKYLKDLGYNDYVCAGIMGNLMAEVGGQTLKLNFQSSSDTYYGICQWNKTYSKIWGGSLQEQCDFLRSTIEYEFNTFGYAYKKGFDYNQFLLLENEKDAALAFAKCYERCASFTYKVRQSNATKAYNYFIK